MKILLCSFYKFPEGDAGAIRHKTFSRMLQKLGHEVFVVGLGAHCRFEVNSFKEIQYTSLREAKSDFWGKVRSHLKYWRRLKRILDSYQPHVVLMDDMWLTCTLQLKRYCKKKHIRLIHDSVEWYSPEQFRWGKLSLGYIKKDMLNKRLIDKSCSVIAISQFLHRHFSKKGISSVNIPIVIAPEDLQSEKISDGLTHFTYAGQAGKKDYLHVMVEAFSQLTDDEKEKIRFHIVGCTYEQLVASGIPKAQLDSLSSCLSIHGRVPRSEVLELLKQTDFTVLMRSPTQRYAKAGFPTKMVESLSTYTPIICNLTSDMALYLQDGENALVAEDCSAHALITQIRRAIAMQAETKTAMQQNAGATAQNRFIYTLWLDALSSVLA